MIDRFGNRIYVGWAAHEIIWLEAALSLLPADREAAFEDIAALSGRTPKAVRYKAERLLRERRDAKIHAERAAKLAAQATRTVLAPYTISPPSQRQLMTGRA